MPAMATPKPSLGIPIPTVPKGSLTALVGANGAGKSTLCRRLSGLLVPTKGSIWLGAEDITDLPPHRRSPRLLLAPESRGVFPELSVEENLSLLLPRCRFAVRGLQAFPRSREQAPTAGR